MNRRAERMRAIDDVKRARKKVARLQAATSVRADQGILASDDEREETVARLRRAGVEGRLSTEGYEWRVERALRATHREQLSRLTRDLPAPDPVRPMPDPTVRRRRRTREVPSAALFGVVVRVVLVVAYIVMSMQVALWMLRLNL